MIRESEAHSRTPLWRANGSAFRTLTGPPSASPATVVGDHTRVHVRSGQLGDAVRAVAGEPGVVGVAGGFETLGLVVEEPHRLEEHLERLQLALGDGFFESPEGLARGNGCTGHDCRLLLGTGASSRRPQLKQ